MQPARNDSVLFWRSFRYLSNLDAVIRLVAAAFFFDGISSKLKAAWN